MLPSPTDALQPDSAADSGWNPVQRIGFRLLFSYLVLYIILVTLIEDLDLLSDFGFAPGGRLVNAIYAKTWARLVSWAGMHVLRVNGPLAYASGGNSDGIFSYTQLFCIAAVAIFAALVWTPLDRRRTEYYRLNAWLRVGVRYALAFSMLSYGMAKVYDVQFSISRIGRAAYALRRTLPIQPSACLYGLFKALCDLCRSVRGAGRSPGPF